MATQSERANKSDATNQAIVLPADNSVVLDDGANITAAPALNGGMIGTLIEAGNGKDKAVQALHSIALSIIYGAARDTDFAALTFPRSIKNEKTYCVKLNAYVAEHGDAALRQVWNSKVIGAQRNRAVSLSGLVAAIKGPTDSTTLNANASSKAQTTGNVQGEREPSVDVMGTLHSILTIINDTTDAQRKVDAIRKLKFFVDATKAKADAHIEQLAKETKQRATTNPSKKATPKNAVASIVPPRAPANATLHLQA